jgi:hypothetical protein
VTSIDMATNVTIEIGGAEKGCVVLSDRPD